jgi:predicted NUDIX family phosphoesterase
MPHDEFDRLADVECVYPAPELHVEPFAAAHFAGVVAIARFRVVDVDTDAAHHALLPIIPAALSGLRLRAGFGGQAWNSISVMDTNAEQVLGIARTLVPGGLKWRGVRGVPIDPYMASIKEFGTFRPRPEAETDPSWKQVIPYLVLRDGEDIFLMRRSRAGGDVRLHDRYTIGVGGHVNPADGGVLGGLQREWDEEIVADFAPDFEPLGVLNDDENAVGAVHLGLVFGADAAGRPVDIRETDKLEGGFVPLADVGDVADLLETWSALLFEFLTDNQPNR